MEQKKVNADTLTWHNITAELPMEFIIQFQEKSELWKQQISVHLPQIQQMLSCCTP